MERQLRMAMIGGGRGAFIGEVHRMAARLDNFIRLEAGAFSSNPKISRLSGRDLFLDPVRVYDNYEQMIEAEKKLPIHSQIDFVSIVTPNHLHLKPARLALEAGFHVICDKPLVYSYQQAVELQKVVEKTQLKFALTHAYAGYPMIKQARNMIKNGELGDIRKIVVEYPQGWLSEPVENKGNKQAAWRTDPERAGISCTMGDIGVHAFHLAEYVSGLKTTQISAELSTFQQGRKLDDDGNVLLRFDNGAKGVLIASQVSAGEENDVTLKIYGEKGGVEWHQMEPNTLTVKWINKHKQQIRTGVGDLSEAAQAHTRVPAGHPEGYIEAFANIYRNFAFDIAAHINNEKSNSLYDYPTIDEGVRGMLFIEKVVESSKSDTKWLDL